MSLSAPQRSRTMLCLTKSTISRTGARFRTIRATTYCEEPGECRLDRHSRVLFPRRRRFSRRLVANRTTWPAASRWPSARVNRGGDPPLRVDRGGAVPTAPAIALDTSGVGPVPAELLALQVEPAVPAVFDAAAIAVAALDKLSEAECGGGCRSIGPNAQLWHPHHLFRPVDARAGRFRGR
jgi:hypothetical protein